MQQDEGVIVVDDVDCKELKKKFIKAYKIKTKTPLFKYWRIVKRLSDVIWVVSPRHSNDLYCLKVYTSHQKPGRNYNNPEETEDDNDDGDKDFVKDSIEDESELASYFHLLGIAPTFHKNYLLNTKYNCFIMEYCQKYIDLFDVGIDSNLSKSDILTVLKSVSSHLSKMHSLKYIHADIKPENIFITNSKQVKLADFGLVLKGPCFTKKIGTSVYIAPEVLIKDCKYTQKCDLWSLGVTAYYIITKKLPFTNRDLMKFKKQEILKFNEKKLLKFVPEEYKEFVLYLIKNIFVFENKRVSAVEFKNDLETLFL